MYSPQTRRILALYRSASPECVARGLDWYRLAYAEAQYIAADAGIRIDQAAGIIAALSPQVSWGWNLEWAARVAHGDYTPGGFYANLGKARAIRESDSDPLDILSGPKVRAFYACILTAGATADVVIDRHAYDLAEGTRGAHVSLTPCRIRATQDSYRRAARRLHETGEAELSPCQLQAITWLAWRARYWSAGAWDGYATDRQRADAVTF
jgi:hypothetical protein